MKGGEIVPSKLAELFSDNALNERVKRKLPYLFQIAEVESSRAGKPGMEVGSARERIIVALLIYKFGDQNVETEIPITEPEIDVRVCNEPVSIKTITDSGGVKAVWTVDAESAKRFANEYEPKAEILLVQIKWEPRPVSEMHPGGLFWIPLEVQRGVFAKLG
ncbi:MAG TPA: ThaI family type II restriction endonuclease, partial [candidate division Zixibacteria bacterium]|nr:ThaI family type II restriction endonuclease [candidate division Zixibacteria bacterium]